MDYEKTVLVLGDVPVSCTSLERYIPDGTIQFIDNTSVGRLARQCAIARHAPMVALDIPLPIADSIATEALLEAWIKQADVIIVLKNGALAHPDPVWEFARGCAKAYGKKLITKTIRPV